MLNMKVWGARGKLVTAIDAQTEEIKLKFGEGLRFRIPEQDYFYATIRSNGKFEHVKVMAVKGDTLSVVRGQDQTEAQSWASDSCIQVEWNPMQLCEYTRQCVNGTEATSVDAGTYCLDCATCIEIGEDGRITAVNGAKKC